MAKRKAKTKTNGKTKPSNPKIEAGANRRAAAVLTRDLRRQVEALEEKEAMLRAQKKRLFDTYSNDTGRSIGATKRMLQLIKMDPNVRDTYLRDERDIAEDLAIAPDMPLFADAMKQQAAVDAQSNEVTMPGYVAHMGRQAFEAKRTLDQHPFPDDAHDLVEKWQAGFIAAQTEKDEADERRRAERAAAKAAKQAEAEAAAAAE